jgi:hypothetical protein
MKTAAADFCISRVHRQLKSQRISPPFHQALHQPAPTRLQTKGVTSLSVGLAA